MNKAASIPVPEISPTPPPAVEVPSQSATFKKSAWKDFERKVIENWTGIIGSVAIVAGVGFLGIYAAVQMQAFYHFLILAVLAISLFVCYLMLRHRAKWAQLAHWLGSAGVAIFLFACVGSGAIPALQWVTNPWLGLGLLLIGIVANLGFAFIGGMAIFASLHTILSMLALSFHPTDVTLVVAVLVSLAAISFSYKYRWDLHLILTLTSFFGFVVTWRFFPADPEALNESSRWLAKAAVGVVALAAGLVHYRKDYASKRFQMLPFVVHLTNWMLAGISFAFLASGSKWKTLILVVAAVGGFFLARRGKALGIRWLYQTDIVISQIVLLITFVSLTPWGADPYTISVFVFLQSLFFSLLMKLEGDSRLQAWAQTFITLSFLCLLGLSILQSSILESGSPIHRAWASAFAAFVALGLFSWSVRKFGETNERMAEGITAGLMPLVLYFMLKPVTPMAAVAACAILGIFVGARHVLRSNGLGVGALIAIIFILVIGWDQYHLMAAEHKVHAMPWIFSLAVLVPLVMGIRFSDWFRTEKTFPNICVYLLAYHLLWSFYFLGHSLSPLLVGVLWLLAAPVFLEIHRTLASASTKLWNQKASEAFLHGSYGFLVAFFFRHIFYHLQVEDNWGIIKVRLLIELLSIVVVAYFLFSKSAGEPSRTWKSFHPLFLELFLLTVIGAVAMEVPTIWHPLAWCMGALILFRVGNHFQALHRLRSYSLFMAWAGVLHVASMMSTLQVPDHHWYYQPWFLGFCALLMSIVYLTMIRKTAFLEVDEFPTALSFVQRIVRKIAVRKHLWIYYPFFISMALFAYWRFESAILTFVFAVFSFIIFSISILHRVPHFRILGLSLVGLCMIRLIFFDLAQSGTLMRGVAFVGVGGIMLLMNVIWLRFHGEAA